MLWDTMTKKIVRRKDVVFLEDRMTDDSNQGESPSFSAGVSINLHPISPLMANTNQWGDAQEDVDGIGNTSPLN